MCLHCVARPEALLLSAGELSDETAHDANPIAISDRKQTDGPTEPNIVPGQICFRAMLIGSHADLYL